MSGTYSERVLNAGTDMSKGTPNSLAETVVSGTRESRGSLSRIGSGCPSPG